MCQLLETSYSRPPIDPYLTSPPLLQNPGGATGYYSSVYRGINISSKRPKGMVLLWVVTLSKKANQRDSRIVLAASAYGAWPPLRRWEYTISNVWRRPICNRIMPRLFPARFNLPFTLHHNRRTFKVILVTAIRCMSKCLNIAYSLSTNQNEA